MNYPQASKERVSTERLELLMQHWAGTIDPASALYQENYRKSELDTADLLAELLAIRRVHFHLSSGGEPADKVQYSRADVNALVTIALAAQQHRLPLAAPIGDSNRAAPEPQPAASQEQFSAVKDFDEWNDVTGALPRGNSWHGECRSIMEDADSEIGRLRQFAHTISAGTTREGIYCGRCPRELYSEIVEGEPPASAHEPAPDGIRRLFNGALGVQKGNRFSFSFATEEEANRAFHYIASLGNLETSKPPSAQPCVCPYCQQPHGYSGATKSTETP